MDNTNKAEHFTDNTDKAGYFTNNTDKAGCFVLETLANPLVKPGFVERLIKHLCIVIKITPEYGT